MKNARRSAPWTIIASAAVAGATFAAVATYVNGTRTQPLEAESMPTKVSEVTTLDPVKRRQESSDREEKDAQRPIFNASSQNLSFALKEGGFEGVRVIGIEVERGLATLDMNSSFVDTLGSTGEGELLELLKSALAKDARVKSFQIRVDGEIQKSLGHTDLSEPLSVR